MAVMMQMEWPGVTAEQYEQVRVGTNFEGDPPAGGIFHVAALDGDKLRITDVWETPEQFQAFVEQRLMPCVQSLGITAEPQVSIYPAINVFNPGAK
jgi:hypothetical protein